MMLSERKQIHLTNYDYSGSDATYFITLCTNGKQAYFRKPQVAQYIADEINYRARTAEEILVFAYCIMPDHLHLLLKLNDGYGKTLQNWVAAFKRYTARLLNQLENITPLWQNNFYEHVVRTDESMKGIAEYIVHNPIRKNMVSDWQEYRFLQINYDSFK
jgi:putative transposase